MVVVGLHSANGVRTFLTPGTYCDVRRDMGHDMGLWKHHITSRHAVRTWSVDDVEEVLRYRF